VTFRDDIVPLRRFCEWLEEQEERFPSLRISCLPFSKHGESAKQENAGQFFGDELRWSITAALEMAEVGISMRQMLSWIGREE
jgi:hypothetical protein